MTKPQTPNLSSLNDTFDLVSHDKQHGHSNSSTKKLPNTNINRQQQHGPRAPVPNIWQSSPERIAANWARHVMPLAG